jgi:hypothetical protein
MGKIKLRTQVALPIDECRGEYNCYCNDCLQLARPLIVLLLVPVVRPRLVFSGEWITRYTRNSYDFSVLGTAPITFSGASR